MLASSSTKMVCIRGRLARVIACRDSLSLDFVFRHFEGAKTGPVQQ
jgi:hypothetical protein